MRIQESLVTDKQIALELFSENGKYRLPIEGKDYYFPTLEKVHEAFLNQNTYDTIKLTHNGKKSYLHLFMDEIEVFDTKKALRQRLSQDSQGMWSEIRNGKKHYYVEERGWMSTSYKEITEQQCLEQLQYTSTMTKVLSIGLGMLALLPGAFEFARRLPIGTKEAAMGLIALNQKSPLLGAVGYSLLPSKAEAQAVGTEFQINTYTTNSQEAPCVAPLNDGGFVVVWQSNGQDGDGWGIYRQMYDKSGLPNGPESRVNTYTTSFQDSPIVTPLNTGGFVVIWQSYGRDGSGYGTYGQRYDSSGAPLGSEFKANTHTASDQLYAGVAPLNDGGFVVTWASYDQDGDRMGIYGQRYDSSGTAVGTEFLVNSYTTSYQSYPSVAPLNDGGFVVTWESEGQDGGTAGIYGEKYGIYGQRFDSNAAAVGSEFQINTYIASDQRYPSVAPLQNGGFVVTWQSYGQDGSDYGIYGQRYDSNGATAGTEFQINTYTTNAQSSSSVASLKDGGFVVTWASDLQDGGKYGIYGQRYDSNGSPAGIEFQINTYITNLQESPSVAPLDDGGFVVTWQSYGQIGGNYDIFGQRYDASGNPIPLQIPTSSSLTQATPSQSSPIQATGSRQSGFTFPTVIPSITPSPTLVTANAPTSSTRSLIPSSSNRTSTSLTSSTHSITTLSSTPSPTPVTTWSALPSSSNSSSPSNQNTPMIQTITNQSSSSSTVAKTKTASSQSVASVENIVYGQSYPIFLNDQNVGTYTVSGGTGLLDSGNSNVISFAFDPSFQPEEGEVITLFTIPDEEVGLWEGIQIEGESIECLEPHGNIETKLEGASYQIIFEEATCLNMAPTILATSLTLTLN